MEIPRAILSDADGTLVDTLHLIRHGQYETSRAYLTQHGIPTADIPGYEVYEALLHQAIGGSARDTLERTVRLLYQQQPHHLDGIDFDALHDMLNPVQDRIAPEFVHAYEGLSDFLRTLGETGVKLAIFTSGTPHHVVRNFGIALPEVGLTGLFRDASRNDTDKLHEFEAAVKEHFGLPGFTVVTCDDTEAHKPNPEGLLIAMRRLDVTSAQSLVLGDHTVDMQSGINAGVKQKIGITHGFESAETLRKAGATSVVSSLPELAASLMR